MRLKNLDESKTFSSHAINPAIAEIKLPNLGKGKSWKAKEGAISKTVDGKTSKEKVTYHYNEARATGVYFHFEGKLNYVRDRDILEAGELSVAISTPKPKLTEEQKAINKANRTKASKVKTLNGLLEKNPEFKETIVASDASSGRTKKIDELDLAEVEGAIDGIRKSIKDAKQAEKDKKAEEAAKKAEKADKPGKEAGKPAKAQPDTGAA